MVPGVEFRVFGSVEVRRDGVRVRLGGAGQRRLLAVLLSEAGRVVSLDRLVAALWPDDTATRSGARTVRTYLSRLRAVLGAGFVITREPGYLIDLAGAEFDQRRFEDLVAQARRADPGVAADLYDEALGSWRGRPYAEFSEEWWARPEVLRLDELRLVAIEERIELLVGLGRHAEVVPELRRLTLEHPYRERFTEQLMVALRWAGREADAHRAYENFRTGLGEDVGLEPSEELTRLDRSIAVAGSRSGAGTKTLLSPDMVGCAGLADRSPAVVARRDELARRATDVGLDMAFEHAGDAVVGGVRLPRVALIGRDREIGWLTSVLAPGELVTLTGPGGVGKTLLALTAAARGAAAFVDGSWLVELAAVSATDDLLAIIAASLGLFAAERPVTAEGIARVVADQDRLIVVDNCEHVIGMVRSLVDVIMSMCPGVCVLATSRESLGCVGERLLRVGPLSVEGQTGSSPAERMFRERVVATMAMVEFDGDDARSIREICTCVDGLPLAIELAAARVAPLGLAEVHSRLVGHIDLPARSRIDRHSNLTTVVAWSYDLLSRDEQLLLERLAVFADGFNLAAVVGVCGTDLDPSVEDHLISLIDKSLVEVRRTTHVRYRLLEVIRRHAEERLVLRGESQGMVTRFVGHYVAWVTCADEGTRGVDELRWHHQFDLEWNNLRSAFEHAVASGDVDAACQIVWHSRWWAAQRQRLEIGDWADRVLTMPGVDRHPLTPIAFATSAEVARRRFEIDRHHLQLRRGGELEQMFGEAPEPWLAQSRAWSESVGLDGSSIPSATEIRRRSNGSAFWDTLAELNDGLMSSVVLSNLTTIDRTTEQHLHRLERCVALADDLGNPTCIAKATNLLGGALRQVDPVRAVTLLERALGIARVVGNAVVESEILWDLAMLYAETGRVADAIEMQRDAIQNFVRAGAWYQAWDMAIASFRGLVAEGERRAACLIMGRLQAATPPPEWYDNLIPRHLAVQLEADLGAIEMSRVVDLGRSMTPVALVGEVLSALG